MNSFNRVSKCEWCSWEGSVKNKGPHIRKEHLEDINRMVIESCNKNGSSVEEIADNTGLPKDKVRNRLLELSKFKRIIYNDSRRMAYPLTNDIQCSKCGITKSPEYFDYRSIVKNQRHKICKECRRNRESNNIVKNLKQSSMIVEPNQDKANQLMEKIYKQADEVLRERHNDEYHALIEEKITEMLKLIS